MLRARPSAVLLLAILSAAGSSALGGCASTADGGAGAGSELNVGILPDASVDAAPPATDGGVASSDASSDASTEARALHPAPITTTFGPRLAAIGLDVNQLPPLHDLPTGQKMKVMKTFNETLNTTCDGCHDMNDFSAPTRQKETAALAWEGIARKLTLGDGTAIYCDSCHQGKYRFLDRDNHQAMEHWMKDNFVDKLKRKDGEPMGCLTCHASDPRTPTH